MVFLGDIMTHIKFTKNFSSPVYGHVYIGKEVMINPIQAIKYINSGLAEEIQAKKTEEIKETYISKVKDNGTDKPKRSKKSSKGR